MNRVQWPAPEQIGAYLTAHGWQFGRPMKQPGAVYVYHLLSDTGNPVELFVPDFAPRTDAVEDFASSVLAVVDTLESFEGRDAQSIIAEMLAIDAPPAPRAPVVPVP